MSILLRTLTMKSKINFGRYRDYTVGQIIEMRRHKVLISIYYKITSINFTEDVLKALMLKDEYLISKPGKCNETYDRYIENDYYFFKWKNSSGANKLKKSPRQTKGYLQSKNQSK